MAAMDVQEMARLGNAARNRSMTPKQRSAAARKAALARWGKRKRRRPAKRN